MGVIAPNGVGVDNYWNSLEKGVSGIDWLDFSEYDRGRPDEEKRFKALTPDNPDDHEELKVKLKAHKLRAKYGGQVKGFNLSDLVQVSEREIDRTSRFQRFAVATAKESLESAGIELEVREIKDRKGVLTDKFLYVPVSKGLNLDTMGSIIGVGYGDPFTNEGQFQNFMKLEKVNALTVPLIIINLASGWVGIKYKLRGANFGTVAACASAYSALATSVAYIKSGLADLLVTGGTEACMSPYIIKAFQSTTALTSRDYDDNPQAASRPGDKRKSGFVIAEGCGLLTVESYESAKNRGATPLAEIIGIGISCDANEITAPDPSGEGLVRAMQSAIRYAGISPQDIDHVDLHFTATKGGDQAEVAALNTVFGAHINDLSFSAIKSLTGHSLGAAAGFEAVASLLMMKNGYAVGNPNYEEPHPECVLPGLKTEGYKKDINILASNSLGFGGQNFCVIFKKFEGYGK